MTSAMMKFCSVFIGKEYTLIGRKLCYKKQFEISLKPYLSLTCYRHQCLEAFTSPSNILSLALGIFSFGLLGVTPSERSAVFSQPDFSLSSDF